VTAGPPNRRAHATSGLSWYGRILCLLARLLLALSVARFAAPPLPVTPEPLADLLSAIALCADHGASAAAPAREAPVPSQKDHCGACGLCVGHAPFVLASGPPSPRGIAVVDIAAAATATTPALAGHAFHAFEATGPPVRV
jgi:hypothetical protein